MKKETFNLMRTLIGILEKEKFDYVEIEESEYSDLYFKITVEKEEKKKK